MTYTHASLFSGIGGAELAASWLGWTNVFHCEIQEFQRKVLEYWFPNSVSYEDITKTDFSEWRGHIDVLTGGFPCQPFSVAGKRKGAEDNRYLWREMLRAIRQIQPTWVVGENVNGILSMVQPGKETKLGRTDDLFDENFIYRKEQKFTIDAICEDLESAGYSVQPIVIPACAVGAPHRRDRVWIVARLNADTDCQRCAGRGSQTYKREKASKRASVFRNIERPCGEQDVANSANARAESVQQGWEDGISELGLTIDTKCERWAKGGNGNKIYEGDIVTIGNNLKAVVIWFNGSFRFKDELSCKATYFDDIGVIMRDYDVCIIGNIHDNPEMLKGVK